MLFFDTDIQYLKGIGPTLGLMLNKKGIFTVEHLLHYFPRTYIEQKANLNFQNLCAGDLVLFEAFIQKIQSFQNPKNNNFIHTITLRCPQGYVFCKYFKLPFHGYLEHFQPGQKVRVHGKISFFNGKVEFIHPQITGVFSNSPPIEEKLVPIYSEMENLTSQKIHKLILQALQNVGPEVWANLDLPPQIRSQLQLIPLKDALYQIHNPSSIDSLQSLLQIKHPAQERIIFQEFFIQQLRWIQQKNQHMTYSVFKIKKNLTLSEQFKKSLPFTLTNSQIKAHDEIRSDMQSHFVMNRLLQGDVGSGKTVVSFLAALDAIESGYQCAMMAPTEILADQHYQTALRWLSPLGIRVGLFKRTHKLDPTLIKNHQVDFVIGTHALLEDSAEFKSLGLIIIDEQHRFGVQQRDRLLSKSNKTPHTLVMSATPIPRTLALTFFGDLDVSILEQSPLGRPPVRTLVLEDSQREFMYQVLLSEVQKGRQAFVIYPLVSESEKMDLKNANQEFCNLKNIFSSFSLGMIHGQMNSELKTQMMSDFSNGKLQIIVSTTVVEVGVDIPNATLMIVEHAERFGLAQLHQLRGRVGRGVHPSICLLILGPRASQDAYQRIKILEEAQNGFRVSEKDLEIRGPGEFFGTQQSGFLGFKLADPLRHPLLLEKARVYAMHIANTP